MSAFFALPKVHKHNKNPPVTPIVSGIGHLTSHASIMVDKFLKPLVEKLPSFLKDNIYLLNILHKFSVSTSMLLVSIDVESLYSNMPHDWALESLGTLYRI